MKLRFSIVFLSVLALIGCSKDTGSSSSTNTATPGNYTQWVPGSNLGKPLQEYSSTNPTLYPANIYDLCAYKGALYVAGDFTVIGGQIIKYLARWDGSSWSSVGQLTDPVQQLIVFDNKLFIATSDEDNVENCAGWGSCSKVYSYDGNTLAREFLQSGQTLNLYQGDLWEPKDESWTIHDNMLFAYVLNQSGIFQLAWYDGTSWRTDNRIRDFHGVLKSFDGDLYATRINYDDPGVFRFRGDFNNLQASTDTVEIAHGNTLTPPEIRCAEIFNGKLVVSGNFETIDGLLIRDIAEFDGSIWRAVGDWDISADNLKTIDGNLYASFYLHQVNTALGYTNHGVYNGGQWLSLHLNLDEHRWLGSKSGSCFEKFNGEIYMGGVGGIGSGGNETNNFLKLQ